MKLSKSFLFIDNSLFPVKAVNGHTYKRLRMGTDPGMGGNL